MTKIEEFKKKYGMRTLGMLVDAYIRKVNDGVGQGTHARELAGEIEPILRELESALEEVEWLESTWKAT